MASPQSPSIFRAAPALLRRPASLLRKNWRSFIARSQTAPISVSACLQGGESGAPAATFSRMTGDLLRASRPIAAWPHVKLLRQFQQIGERLWEPAVFQQTDYFRNAVNSVEMCGAFHGAVAIDQIQQVARSFVDRFQSLPANPTQLAQNRSGSPIVVHPIQHSTCLQVVDGHHRLAMAFVKGVAQLPGQTLPPAVSTPLQDLLADAYWLHGRRELYQPLPSPELSQWVLVRRCTDRLAKMQAFLAQQGITPPASYIDVASFYGWFVAQMAAAGFKAQGVERDPMAALVGQLVYGLTPQQISRAECVSFLRNLPAPIDVVSCFSLAHHFLLNPMSITAEELLRLLDSVTGRVLFFDMGHSHEYAGRENFRGWDADSIQQWLQKNTTFSHIIPLGPDEDGVAPFEGEFGRMLFACVR